MSRIEKIARRAAALLMAAVVALMGALPCLMTLLHVWRLRLGVAFLFGLMAAVMIVTVVLPTLAAAASLWQSAAGRQGKEEGQR